MAEVFLTSAIWHLSSDICSRQRLGVADRAAGGKRCRCGHNGVGIDAVVPIEVGNRAGLAEMLDPERTSLVPVHGAQPGECCRMAVEHRDNAAVGGNVGKQLLD